ncbi:hypothetical protein HAX54_051089, partial [Datura stramonium]|nr:hypothetical protein [Datura stramonium]
VGSKYAKIEVRTTLALPCARQQHTGARRQHFSTWAGARCPNICTLTHKMQHFSCVMAGAHVGMCYTALDAEVTRGDVARLIQ